MTSVRPAKGKAAKQRETGRTWEHPKGSGIVIAETPNFTGGKAYGVSYRIRIPARLTGGKREQLQRNTRAEAERLAEDRCIALKAYGTEFSKIPPEAQKLAAMAWGIVSEHNDKTKLGLNFIDVVKAGLRVLSPEGGRKTVAEVVAELVASKTERRAAGKLGAFSLHDFKVRTAKIVKAFGPRFAGDVLHTEIAAWLSQISKDGSRFGGPLSTRSVRNYRIVFAEVFRHAKARRYCADNPFERFTREDLKTLGGETSERDLDSINILTVEEVRRLLNAAQSSGKAEMLPGLVLRLFCGVRTTELCRLDWSEIRWLDAKPYVHIPAGKAKKRRIRHIDIPENAAAWLRLCNPPAGGPIIEQSDSEQKTVKAYCTRFAELAKAARIGWLTDGGDWQSDWEANDTRHSFGSYHYALHGDSLKTAGLMGHSQNDHTLFAHYRSLVRKEDAAEFFAIVPDAAAGKVTAFPQAATA